MTYEDWENEIHASIRGDTLWRMEAYRLSLFLGDLVWKDSEKLLANKRTIGIADQLYRAAGHVSACIAEGYSRDSGRARSVFYEYALGSARESRDWYYKSRRVFGDKVTEHRLDLTTQIIKLTLKMVATERRSNRRASE